MASHLRRLARSTGRFGRSRVGNFATLTALAAPLFLALGAVSIDRAALHVEHRAAQSATDLAAISAAARLDAPLEAALSALRDNGINATTVGFPGEGIEGGFDGEAEIVPGRYEADPARAAGERFIAGAVPHNAVRVTLRKTGRRYFASALFDPPTIVTDAVASATAEAAFSVGSRLLAVEGGILNAVLGGLTGSSLSLKVMDYEALIAADVSLFAFLDALALEMRASAVTYGDLLALEPTMRDMARAGTRIGGLPNAASAALRAIAEGGGGSRLALSRLLDLGPAAHARIGRPPPGLAVTAGLMELLSAAAIVAGGGNQVSLDLTAAVPGLLGVSLDVAIGEPPQASPFFSIGGEGTLVRTAQTRLRLLAEVGGVLGVAVRVPIYVELAPAAAMLADVACPAGPGSLRVSIDARPGIAGMRIADVGSAQMRDFRSAPSFPDATIVKALFVTVKGRAHAAIANTADTRVAFNAREVADGAVKTVSTRNYAQSLTRTLLGNLSLRLEVVGLGLGVPSGLTGTVAGIVGAATPALDAVLHGVLAALGVRLGEADLRVHGASCGRPVLVQ